MNTLDIKTIVTDSKRRVCGPEVVNIVEGADDYGHGRQYLEGSSTAFAAVHMLCDTA